MWSLGVFLVLLGNALFIAASPKVTTPQGAIEGKYMETISKRKISAFLKIPYAKPPVGQLRFAEPVPAEPWNGVLNGTQEPPFCLLWEESTFGTEDCLFLNVYVPEDVERHKDNPLPVLAFIHGGGFVSFTSTLFGPEYLLDRNVILVTMNYRLGILGFFSTEDNVVPGNNGLKDQRLALRWIQKNIKAFNGDPNKVTMAGQSAGAGSAHYHLLSPSGKDLFQRVIMVSGAALASWDQMEKAKEKAQMVAQYMNCPITNSQAIVDCLRTKDGAEIQKLLERFLGWSVFPFTSFGPIVEHSHPTAIIDKNPVDIIKNRQANDVPTWFTTLSEDGLYPAGNIMNTTDRFEDLDKNWTKYARFLLDFNYTVPHDQQAKISQQIRKEYFGDKQFEDNKRGFVDLLSDRTFKYPVVRSAKLHAASCKSPVYASQFSYIGKRSHANLFMDEDRLFRGAAHGDDLLYVLRTTYLPIEEDREAREMSKKMIDVWMTYIQGLPFPQEWKTIKETLPVYSYMQFSGPNKPDVFVKDKNFARESFWNELKINERRH